MKTVPLPDKNGNLVQDDNQHGRSSEPWWGWNGSYAGTSGHHNAALLDFKTIHIFSKMLTIALLSKGHKFKYPTFYPIKWYSHPLRTKVNHHIALTDPTISGIPSWIQQKHYSRQDFCSSDPSMQSLWPSHTLLFGKHCPSSQRKSSPHAARYPANLYIFSIRLLHSQMHTASKSNS